MKKKYIQFCCLLLIVYNFTINVKAETVSDIVPLASESAILISENSELVLYQKNADQKMYPASTTKIMTAIILVEHFEDDEVIIVSNEVLTVPLDSSKAGHVVGEKIKAKDLLRALIIQSGNDSSCVAARAVAEKLQPELNSYQQKEIYFARLMNEKAKEIGANNTNFVNPHGYHNINHYTTAHDMACIAKAAFRYPNIREVSKEILFSVNNPIEGENKEGQEELKHEWKTHNKLIDPGNSLFYSHANGIKTGYTKEAGYCLTASAEKNDMLLIGVVFNASEQERFQDVVSLFEFGYDQYEQIQIQKQNEEIVKLPLLRHNKKAGNEIAVYSKNDFFLVRLKKLDGEIERNVILDEGIGLTKNDEIFIYAPIEKDQKLGKIEYLNEDNVIYEDEIFASAAVEKASKFSVLFDYVYTNKLIALGILILIILVLIILHRRKKRNRYYY